MKLLAKILSGTALAATLAAPCLFFADQLSLAALKTVLLAAAIVWLVATPFWMERNLDE
jgi:hypothetical protein